MPRCAALVALLAGFTVPAQHARADVFSDGEEPTRQPKSDAASQSPVRASMLLRIPSGLGVNIAVRPLKRLELGAEVSSWLLISEAGVYARGTIVSEEGTDVTLGARYHTICNIMGEDVENRTSRLVSVEIGFNHLTDSGLWGVGLGKAIWMDGGLADRGSIGFTGEVRIGEVW
jgi:hypothetical protein